MTQAGSYRKLCNELAKFISLLSHYCSNGGNDNFMLYYEEHMSIECPFCEGKINVGKRQEEVICPDCGRRFPIEKEIYRFKKRDEK